MRRHLLRVLPLLLIASGVNGRAGAEEGAADKGELATFRGVVVPAHDRAAILRIEQARLEAIRKGSVVQRRDPTVGPTELHPIDLGVSTFIVDDFEQGLRWEPITWAGQPETEVVTPAGAATGQILKLECEPHSTGKSGIGLRMSTDASSFDRLLFDCHLAEVQSCHLAIAFWTGEASEFFETPWIPVAQGWNEDLAVHLRSGTFKCAASGWQHTSSLSNPQAIRKVLVLVYHKDRVSLMLDNIRLVRGTPPAPAVDGQAVLSVLPASYRRAWVSLAKGESALGAKEHDAAAAAFEAALGQCGAVYGRDVLSPNARLMAGIAEARLALMDREMAAKGLVRFDSRYVPRDGSSFESALAAKPDDFETRICYVRFLAAQGQPEEAAEQAATALQTARDSKQIARTQAHLEELYVRHINDDSASAVRVVASVEKGLLNAIAARPTIESNHNLLAKLYTKAGRTEDAAEMYLAQPYRRSKPETRSRPRVGVYFYDRAPRGFRIRYGSGLKDISVLERGGFEPALLVLPRLHDHSELRRYLRMVDSPVEFLNWGREDDWRKCAAVVMGWPWRMPEGGELAVIRYVEEGGGLIVIGGFGREETDPGVREALLGTDAMEFEEQGEDLVVAAEHPIVRGLAVGQVLPGPRRGYALKADVRPEEVILRYKGSDRFAMAAREVGRGRVVHFCWSGPVSTMVGQAGDLTDADLLLRAIDWVSRKERKRDVSIFAVRPPIERLPERLGTTADVEVLFEDRFDKLDDTTWQVIDVDFSQHDGRNRDPSSKWFVHPTLHQLMQFTNIGAWGARGSFGTNILARVEDVADCVVSVWATPIDDDYFVILFRYRDEGNYYRLVANGDGHKYWALQRVSDGRQHFIQRISDRCFIPGRSYLVEIAAYQDKIHVYLDGELLMHVTDAAHKTGRFGLCCMGQNGMAFDDLVVYGNDSGWGNAAVGGK